MPNCHNCPHNPEPGTDYNGTQCAYCDTPAARHHEEPRRGHVAYDSDRFDNPTAQTWKILEMYEPSGYVSPQAQELADFLRQDRHTRRQRRLHGPASHCLAQLLTKFTEQELDLLAALMQSTEPWSHTSNSTLAKAFKESVSKQGAHKYIQGMVKKAPGLAHLLTPKTEV